MLTNPSFLEQVAVKEEMNPIAQDVKKGLAWLTEERHKPRAVQSEGFASRSVSEFVRCGEAVTKVAVTVPVASKE